MLQSLSFLTKSPVHPYQPIVYSLLVGHVTAQITTHPMEDVIDQVLSASVHPAEKPMKTQGIP